MNDAEKEIAKKNLSDIWWRINNLYYIIDENGNKVLFNCNFNQDVFYKNLHQLNIILKARQLGFSTFIQIIILDACVFKSNIRAGVIAHTREDAENIFEDKIKFAYDNLPAGIKQEVFIISDNLRKLSLSNGSSIRVGTSLRSGTLQYLHVSELGKIAKLRPDKAKEIKTGALNTVHAGNYIFVESTAEGPDGLFHDICQDSIKLQEENRPLLDSEFKFHFFPWYNDKRYVLDIETPFTEEEIEYFINLDQKLTKQQQNWYVMKWRQQRLGGEDNMGQEYPSTPEEAFDVKVECSFFSSESIDMCFKTKPDVTDFIRLEDYQPEGYVIN